MIDVSDFDKGLEQQATVQVDHAMEESAAWLTGQVRTRFRALDRAGAVQVLAIFETRAEIFDEWGQIIGKRRGHARHQRQIQRSAAKLMYHSVGTTRPIQPPNAASGALPLSPRMHYDTCLSSRRSDAVPPK